MGDNRHVQRRISSDRTDRDAVALDTGAVLEWGMPRMRDLPWRHTRDPWRILVAEVMLQQTPIDRVIPKWEAFLTAFADIATCANAPFGDILRRWQGLGYPRRARNLHSTARTVMNDHGGRLPDDVDALLTLPGIGPYTAGAVLAFAFERDIAVVDTNVARILARTAGERLTSRRAQKRADASVPAGTGWTWNQVIIDLGAELCRPTPDCEPCPLAPTCRWHCTGHPDPDPATGSAGVSVKQAPFEGSDRQVRGSVLRSLAAGPSPAANFDERILAGLMRDGLVARSADTVHLPEE